MESNETESDNKPLEELRDAFRSIIAEYKLSSVESYMILSQLVDDEFVLLILYSDDEVLSRLKLKE